MVDDARPNFSDEHDRDTDGGEAAGSRPPDAATLNSVLLVAYVALSAVVVAAASFLTVRSLTAVDQCEAAQQHLLELQDAYPDAESIPATVSADIYATGGELREVCSYNEAVEFESNFVFPWLSPDDVPPPPDPPGAPSAPAAPSAPGVDGP